MSLVERVKAWPMPEPDMSHRKALDDPDEETSYSEEAIRTARESVAAEADREMARLCEALDGLLHHWPAIELDGGHTAVDNARAARSEARKT